MNEKISFGGQDASRGGEVATLGSGDEDYKSVRDRLERHIDTADLDLKVIDREELESLAPAQKRYATCEQSCVNYLRHSASRYDSILHGLSAPSLHCSTKLERHVLHVEHRSLVARLKKRVLDEIAQVYPWLANECARQKSREGVEDEPGDFVMPFGPYKGRPLCEIETDYLIRLLGQSMIRKSFRTRIERHVAERAAGKARRPA